jgi:uncharacterized membrane protein
MVRKLFSILVLVALLMIVFATPALAHDGVGGDELAVADSMLIVGAAFFVMSGFGLIYSIQNGEYRNPEKTKRDMLRLALRDENGEDLDKYVTVEEQ